MRHNESHNLDRLWRENLVSARTAKANKTNYRKVSIVLVLLRSCPRRAAQHILPQYTHAPLDSLTCWLGHAYREAQYVRVKESVISNTSRFAYLGQFIYRLKLYAAHHARYASSRAGAASKARDTATPKDVCA